MTFRITGVVILRNYLRSLDPVAITNDEETANFVSCRTWGGAPGGPKPQELVIVDLERDGGDMLSLPGTYLVIGNAVERVRTLLGTHSNAVVVGEAHRGERLDRLVGELFECIQNSYAPWNAASVTFFSGEPNLRAVLSSFESSLGHPIALFDIQGRLVEAGAQAETQLGDELAVIPPVGVDEVANEDDYPVVMDFPCHPSTVVCPLRLPGGDFYVLDMFEVLEGTRDARMLIYGLSPLVRQLLVEHGRAGRGVSAAAFLSDAVSGRWRSPAIIAQQAERAGLRFETGSRLVVVGFREDRALYSDVQSLRDSLAWAGETVTCIHDYEVVCLLGQRTFDAFVAKLSDLLRKREAVGPACGVSLPIASVDGLFLAHRQCIQAVRVGRQADPRRQVFRYEGVMGDDLVREACHHMGMEPFRLPAAEAMLRSDLEERTEYALTLYTWLRNFQHLGRTASGLCVHRNTVAFRLKRAEMLFGIDTDDVAQMNDLRCALMVMASEGRLSLRGVVR